MGGTPDAFKGPRYEEAVIWTEQSSDPTKDLRLHLTQDKGLVILVDGVVRSVGETRYAAWQTEVDDRDVDTPPGSPATGYRVIVGGSPTDDFVGHEGEISQWNGTSWVFSTPRHGMVVYVTDEDDLYKQTSSSSPWVWAKIAGTGINEDQHRTLRQLIHFIDDGPAEGFASGAHRETTGTVFPTSIIWYESSSKLKKILERTIVWSGVVPSSDQWEMYDTDGTTVLATATDSFTYTSGIFEVNRTRTIVIY